jgi:hypothetical protein
MVDLPFPLEDTPKWLAKLADEYGAHLTPHGLAEGASRALLHGPGRVLSSRATLTWLASQARVAWTPGASRYVAYLLQARLTSQLDEDAGRCWHEPFTDRVDVAPACRTPRGLIHGLMTAPNEDAPLLYEFVPQALAEWAARQREARATRFDVWKRLREGVREGTREGAPAAVSSEEDFLGTNATQAELLASAESFLAQSVDALAAHRPREFEAPRPTREAPLWTLRAARLRTSSVWPAQLGPRVLRDALGVFATTRLDPSSGHHAARRLLRQAPARWGATSFLRYLSRLGLALGRAVPESPLERVTRGDPWEVGSLSWACTFARLGQQELFLRRSLGATRPEAEVAVRAHAWGMMFTASTLALATLRDLGADPRRFEAAIFGNELPTDVASAWPRVWSCTPAAWAGFLASLAVERQLFETFDEDWFRNPRAEEFFLVLQRPPFAREASAELARGLIQKFA